MFLRMGVGVERKQFKSRGRYVGTTYLRWYPHWIPNTYYTKPLIIYIVYKWYYLPLSESCPRTCWMESGIHLRVLTIPRNHPPFMGKAVQPKHFGSQGSEIHWPCFKRSQAKTAPLGVLSHFRASYTWWYLLLGSAEMFNPAPSIAGLPPFVELWHPLNLLVNGHLDPKFWVLGASHLLGGTWRRCNATSELFSLS